MVPLAVLLGGAKMLICWLICSFIDLFIYLSTYLFHFACQETEAQGGWLAQSHTSLFTSSPVL